MVEYLTGSPFIDDLVEIPWKLDSDGMLAVPAGAGLGVSINMEAVQKHRPAPRPVA
jgi:L-alanine-DL-glutamate epimerase-like enolase superfamily enzyme